MAGSYPWKAQRCSGSGLPGIPARDLPYRTTCPECQRDCGLMPNGMVAPHKPPALLSQRSLK